MTNLRVPLQRSNGRAQWQNPCDTKRLLSLLVIPSRAIKMRGGDGEKGALGSGGRGEGPQVEGVCKA